MNSEITNKLAKISEVMGDGYKFVKVRFTFEKWEKEAKEGNKDSAALIDIIEKFYRILEITSKN